MTTPRQPNPPRSDAYSYLLLLLRHRPRSVAEARGRLTRQGYAPDVVEMTLQRAIATDQLDDVAFAKLWVRDRIWHHPLSRGAVARELRDKGVEADLITRTLEQEYPAVKEVELATTLADERFRRLRAVPVERRTARLLAFLQRRGFSRGLAIEAVRSVEEAMQREDE